MISTLTPPQLLAILDSAESATLTATHLRFLLLIQSSTREAPMASPTVIASRMKVSVACIGELGKLMQSRKLITRTRDTTDDRRITYQLTATARQLLTSVLIGQQSAVTS